jgi:hypothetical protein
LELLMLQTSAKPRPHGVAARLQRNAIRIRVGGNSYLAGLQAALGIADVQSPAWMMFAAAVSANNRRMQDTVTAKDEPFGPLAERLAALETIRRAAIALFAILDLSQQRKATQLLPLCCLPTTGTSQDTGTPVSDPGVGCPMVQG